MLAPPGGGTSFSLGVASKTTPQPEPVVAAPKEQPKADVAEMEMKKEIATAMTETKQEQSETAVATGEDKEPSKTSTIPKESQEELISANAFVSGSNMNGGCVMTGRPTSRVLAPPGGHTSFKLG